MTDAIRGWLADHDCLDTDGSIEGPEDWRGIAHRLARDGYPAVARRVDTLAERYDRPKPMLARVVLETDEPLDFVAGQSIGLRYDDTSRAYSLASSPARDDIELCVRRVPGGRLSPQICDGLEPGDELTVRGPYGELVLGKHSPRDVVFFATGTGVAPSRA